MCFHMILKATYGVKILTAHTYIDFILIKIVLQTVKLWDISLPGSCSSYIIYNLILCSYIKCHFYNMQVKNCFARPKISSSNQYKPLNKPQWQTPNILIPCVSPCMDLFLDRYFLMQQRDFNSSAIKNANEWIQAFRGLHGQHLPNIVCQSSTNRTAIRVVVRYL
jgi:hypothetical protein